MSTSPRLEILEYCETELGVLCLRRRELLSSPGTIVTEVILDQEFLMSSYNTESENALATAALEWHGGRELDVLVDLVVRPAVTSGRSPSVVAHPRERQVAPAGTSGLAQRCRSHWIAW